MNAQTQNHFEWFELPLSFDIDLGLLRAKYLELQQKLHPDQLAADSSVDQDQAVVRNTQLNDAYDKLKDPTKRAIYLLELAGIEYDPDRQTQDDPIYLMRQLEIREELAELEANTANLDKRLDEFRSLALAQLEQYSDEFRQAYQDANWTLAAAAIGRMMFAGKLTRDINEREEQLLDL